MQILDKRNHDSVVAEKKDLRISAFPPWLAVIASITSLSVGTSYGKHLFTIVGPQGAACYRTFFAAIILLAIWRPWRQKISQADARGILKYGVIMGLMNVSFYMSINYLPMGPAIAIEFLGPLAVAVFSSRRKLDFLWVALVACGLTPLLPWSVSASSLSPTGLFYAGAAALFWGLYIVFGKRIGHVPGGQAVSLGMLTAAIVAAPFGIARAGSALFNPELLPPAICLAIMSSAIPYSLEMYALKKMPRFTFGILACLDPVFGALAGLLILNEHLTMLQWISIACVIAASIGSTIGTKNTTGASTKDGCDAVLA